MDEFEYKKQIINMLKKIKKQETLKRIYHLIEYLYIYKKE